MDILDEYLLNLFQVNKIVDAISSNSVTFSHIIDETVIFEMEMHGNLFVEQLTH